MTDDERITLIRERRTCQLIVPTTEAKDGKYISKGGSRRQKVHRTGRAGPGRLSKLSNAGLRERLLDHQDELWDLQSELGDAREASTTRQREAEGAISAQRKRANARLKILAEILREQTIQGGSDLGSSRAELARMLSERLDEPVSPTTLSRPEYRQVILTGVVPKLVKGMPNDRSQRDRALKQAPRRELIWRILQIEKEIAACRERAKSARDEFASTLEAY